VSGRFQRFNAGVRSALEADVGPVDDAECGVGPCKTGPVYRVPWHSVGGDIAYCGYHLARYREQHPELFKRVQEAVDEDLSVLATRGDRFLTFEKVPNRIGVDGVEFVAVALLATGNALFEEDSPDDTVVYIVVDRCLEEDSWTEVARGRAGEFLRDIEDRLGVHEWADDIEAALYRGEPA